MNSFTRMTARRGWPKKIVCDNGSNFVAADREIRELVAELDQEQIRPTTANKGVEWYWNPPAATHFGGVFESIIKAANLTRRRPYRRRAANLFHRSRKFTNSRPLTTISDDPNDEPVLTPNYFIIGQMGRASLTVVNDGDEFKSSFTAYGNGG